MIPKTDRSRSSTSTSASQKAETKKPSTTPSTARRPVDELSSGRGAALRASSKKYLMTDPGGGGGRVPEYRATTDVVNLRSVPSATGNVPIKMIPKGATVEVTPDAAGQTRKDGFVHVAWNDAGTRRDGWISEQYTAPAKAPAVTPATQPTAPRGAVVYTSDVLNLRPGPDTGNTPIAQIPGGQKLEVTADPSTGKTREGDFLHVSWNDQGTRRDGWVYGPYTTSTPTAPSTAPTTPVTPPKPAGPETVFVDCGGGNLTLRAGATTSSAKLGKIPDGTELLVTADGTGATRKDGFVHVTWDDKGVKNEGWVSEQYTQPGSIGDAKDLHINQFAAEKEVTDVNGKAGDGTNTNCGPTAVVVALRAQGLTIPGVPGINQTGDGADVQAARYWSYKDVDSSMDGVTVGKDGLAYSSMKGGENSTITYFSELQNAVSAAGGKAAYLDPANADGVAAALRSGQSVVLSGNFLDDGGKEKSGVWTRGGGAKEHVVAVTAMRADGKYIVSDPALPNPVVVTKEQLDKFMTGNAGGLTVSS